MVPEPVCSEDDTGTVTDDPTADQGPQSWTRVASLVGVAMSCLGCFVVALNLTRHGWLWFLVVPGDALLLSVWFVAAGSLSRRTSKDGRGMWRRVGIAGVMLVTAALAACVVAVVVGAAQLVYGLVTAVG